MDGVQALIFGERAAGQGLAEPARYDLDALLFVDANGAAARRPINRRATAYAFEHSEAARQHGTSGPPYPCWLYGDIVLVGCDPETFEPVPRVPSRFAALFGLEAPGPPGTAEIEGW